MTSSDKYRRRSERHALFAIMAILTAILSASGCFILVYSAEPEWAVSAACLCAFSIFFTITQTNESLRCLLISKRWVRWDREKNQQSRQ